MKILYIGLDNCPYPDRSLEVRVADYMAGLGHQVHLVVERRPKYDDDQPKNLDVTVGPVVQIALNQIQPPPDFVRQLVNMDFDLVFCSSISGVKLAYQVSQRKKVPRVVQILDIPAYRFNFEQYRNQWEEWLKLASTFDHIAVNTLTAKNVLRETLETWAPTRVDKTPTTVVYYGVDHITAAKAETYKAGHSYLSSVGRLVWDKGFELIFYAQKFMKTPFPIHIVGAGAEAPRLTETASMLNMVVNFHGASSDLDKFSIIKGSLFGVYPDINVYKSGLFPLECMLMGRPCITFDTPVNRERFGELVEYVPYLDVKTLGEMMQNYVDQTAYLQPKFEEAREWVLENRTYAQHAGKLVEVFEQTLKR